MSAGPRIPAALLAALERTINGLLSLDPEGAARLAPLQGRVIRIELRGFGSRIHIVPGADRLQVFGDAYETEPDCTLRGSPVALAGMGLGDRKEDALFSGQVEIEGDSALAQAFGDFIAGLDIDWEEQLSHLTGDPIAHQVGSGLRGAERWGRHSLDTLTEDIKEYLQEEGRLLPSRYEHDAFLAEVDTLRDDTERLAARVARLSNRLPGAGERE